MTKVKKQPRCSICRRIPKLNCDYQQGRCPHIPPMLEITFVKRLINFFKGKNEQTSRSNKTQKYKSRQKRD